MPGAREPEYTGERVEGVGACVCVSVSLLSWPTRGETNPSARNRLGAVYTRVRTDDETGKKKQELILFLSTSRGNNV